ncbi:hypothetical protein PR003_g23532 [Phytophthora rubi]|uniref:Secreted protein n=1 Tax=Phytophthora rubi TaxID=129364 RepID=A0A6A4CYT7_9STRA|nr:hypothetical protein PR003_g23532 [Phytophthora rubi]
MVGTATCQLVLACTASTSAPWQVVVAVAVARHTNVQYVYPLHTLQHTEAPALHMLRRKSDTAAARVDDYPLQLHTRHISFTPRYHHPTTSIPQYLLRTCTVS